MKMPQIYKCDKCKTVYEAKDTTQYYVYPQMKSNSEKEFELCYVCAKELDKWLGIK